MTNGKRNVTNTAAASVVAGLFAAGCLAGDGTTGTGTSDDPIVGGEDWDIELSPWQVALTTDSFGAFCGGSVLTEDWILTAAHCVTRFSEDDPALGILAGVTRVDNDEGDDAQVRGVSEIAIHPDYQSASSGFDIALLRLEEPLELSSSTVSPIAPVTPDDRDAGVQDPGEMASVTGWGATSQGGPTADILQYVEVPIVTHEELEAAYGDVPESQIGAGYLGEGGKDACQGDSGGPLTVRSDDGDEELLAGIVSWGRGCAQADYPGVYEGVEDHYDWIRERVPADDDGDSGDGDGDDGDDGDNGDGDNGDGDNGESWGASDEPNLETVDGGDACTSITVDDSGDASTARVSLEGQHDWRSDLRATLEHDGHSEEVFSTGTFGFGSGSFSLADEDVGGFAGDAQGEWTLCIEDTTTMGDEGVLESWSIEGDS